MNSHVLIVYTNPVEGREDEYNRWYDEIHLRDLLSIPGFVAARRYRMSNAQGQRGGSSDFRYVCIYEIETDDLAKTISILEAAVTDMEISTAAQSVVDVRYFTAVGARRSSG